VNWEVEMKEEWLSYKTIIFNIFRANKQFVYPREMAKWIKISLLCQCCFNPLGPEGTFQLGSYGHTFHVGCIQQREIHVMRCPECQGPLPQKFYKLFGLLDESPLGMYSTNGTSSLI
jgi:hypothetical protein